MSCCAKFISNPRRDFEIRSASVNLRAIATLAKFELTEAPNEDVLSRGLG